MPALLAELQQVEEEQRHFAAGIAAAGDIDVLARDFQDAERRRRLLRDQLAALDRRPQVVLPCDVARVERDLRARLEDWRRLLRQVHPDRPPDARTADRWTADVYARAGRAPLPLLGHGQPRQSRVGRGADV